MRRQFNFSSSIKIKRVRLVFGTRERYPLCRLSKTIYGLSQGRNCVTHRLVTGGHLAALAVPHTDRIELLTLLVNRRLDKAKTSLLKVHSQTIDSVHTESVKVDGVFGTYHLTSTDLVHDAYFLLSHRGLEFALCLGVKSLIIEPEVIHLAQYGFLFLGVDGNEGPAAEIDCVGDLRLRQLGLDVNRTLDD
jgi:hypothetical protein